MGPADGLSFLPLICATPQHRCPYALSSRAFRSFLREKVCRCPLGCKAPPVSDARSADCGSGGYSLEGLGTPTKRLKRPWWVEAAPHTSAAGICGQAPSSGSRLGRDLQTAHGLLSARRGLHIFHCGCCPHIFDR